MRLLGRIVVIVLAVIGGWTLLLFGMGVWAALSFRPPALPERMALGLDLDAGVTEMPSADPLERLTGRPPYVLSELVAGLDRAARDPRVIALVARLDGAAPGMAQTQEVRDAVLAFRKSGKPAYLFSQDLGGFEGATTSVYLASAFKEVWLQPSGDVGLTGFEAESPFLKGTLDMIGVKPEFGARYEYKSAIDMFTQTGMTKENRESIEQLLQSWTRQATEGIATARGLKVEDVRALIDRGPLLGADALSAKLIDRLGYWDELRKSVLEGGASFVDLARYAARLEPEPNAVGVALIVGSGPVQEEADDSPLAEETVMGSDRMERAFAAAAKDARVKAILFRIDSPGGSYTASDAILRDVQQARAAGKPVVVSMGDVAASGAYFVAIGADEVVAEPGTITGSIGVFGGKLVIADLWKKLGISWDEVHTGANAPMWSANQPFTQAGWERLNAMLDHVYADFTDKVAKARNIKPADMDAVARGRIWPGDRAREVGLVDANGGYDEAFAAIRRLARLPSQMPLHLISFPRPRQPIEYLLRMAGDEGIPPGMSGALALEAKIAERLRPFAALLDGGDNFLRLPPFEAK